MAEPYISEIRMVGFNFAPKDWAACDGQLLPISEHPPVYALLGTNFGGNGTTNFAVPQLQGRTPIGWGTTKYYTAFSYAIGNSGGVTAVTLTEAEMPYHRHTVRASSTPANLFVNAGGANLATATANDGYASTLTAATLIDSTISDVGGGQGHSNIQPYTSVLFCIALAGQFPPRN